MGAADFFAGAAFFGASFLAGAFFAGAAFFAGVFFAAAFFGGAAFLAGVFFAGAFFAGAAFFTGAFFSFSFSFSFAATTALAAFLAVSFFLSASAFLVDAFLTPAEENGLAGFVALPAFVAALSAPRWSSRSWCGRKPGLYRSGALRSRGQRSVTFRGMGWWLLSLASLAPGAAAVGGDLRFFWLAAHRLRGCPGVGVERLSDEEVELLMTLSIRGKEC